MGNKKIKPVLGVADGKQLTGRSIFSIETVEGGVKVQTLFLSNNGECLPMPAVFPSQMYALSQVEELRLAITKHFDIAAKVGSKIIADTSPGVASEGHTIQ